MRLLLGVFIFFLVSFPIYSQDCDNNVDRHLVDLSNPTSDTTYWELTAQRSGNCDVNGTNKSPCIIFNIILHPDADIFVFETGAGGSQSYYIDNVAYDTKAEVCLSQDLMSVDTIKLVYCKSGGNAVDYTITVINEVKATDDIAVSDGCSAEISVQGLDENTITWETVPNGTYNDYLSSTANSDTITVTPQPGYPDYIDVRVTGDQTSTCNGVTSSVDTVRVNFVSEKVASITPDDPAICFGGTSATLTATAIGGAPPYSYLWSTGEITQSIDVNMPGEYSVIISDTTACPPIYDTVTVTKYDSEISAYAGADFGICDGDNIVLRDSVTSALGAYWHGGSGTWTNNDSLAIDANVIYTPSQTEIDTGGVNLILMTTRNGDCAAEYDTITVAINKEPYVFAGNDTTVCAAATQIQLSGTVWGGTTTGEWSILNGNAGTFDLSVDNLNNTYSPTAADTVLGYVDFILTSTNNGNCVSGDDTIHIALQPEPVAIAGSNLRVCTNNSLVPLSGTIYNATGGQWSSSGTGTFDQPNTSLTNTYIPSADDITNGTVGLFLTSTGNGKCASDISFMTAIIDPAPSVDAGSNATICTSESSIQLNGSITGLITSTGQWSTSGSGNFLPNNTDLNATYVFDAADYTEDSVMIYLTSTNNQHCSSVIDSIQINILQAATVDAGIDQSVCANDPEITINGSLTLATQAIWTSSMGGTFNSTTDLNTTYNPGSTPGTDTLVLTNTDYIQCPAITDTLLLTITAPPVIDAGTNDSICENSGSIPLSANVIGVYDLSSWNILKGDGSMDDPAALNTNYQIQPTDTLAELEIVVTDNANLCLPVRDTVSYTILKDPVVIAGTNQTICANYPFVLVDDASLQYYDTFNWQTSGSGTITDGGAPDITYEFSSADTASGSVTLTLSANNGCATITDNVIIQFSPAPYVYAGEDKTTCGTAEQLQLNGIVSGGAVTAKWSTSGDGLFSPNEFDLNSIYNFGTNDTVSNLVTLTLTSTNNGGCLPETDQMILTLLDQPIVTITAPDSVCSNSDINLSATITGGSGQGVWTTSNGTGMFSPDNSQLSVQYTPTAADQANGSVSFNFTTINNFTCPSAYKNKNVKILAPPTVEAGANKTVCANNFSVTLNDWNTSSTNFTWSTSGTGSFNASADSSIFEYIPSVADTAAGSVYLKLSVTDGCIYISDSLLATFTPAPSVYAGEDQYLCEGETIAALNGTISGSITTGYWSHSGEGSFQSPTNNLINSYQLMNGDLATKHVSIVLTSNIISDCLPVKDTVDVFITSIPTIEAGANQTICSIDSAELSATVIGGSSKAQWTTSGDGTFYPSDTAATTFYIPGVNDILFGSADLTASTIHSCQIVSDNLTISFTSAPTVNAGADLIACEGTASIALTGNVSVDGQPGNWSTTGNGFFDNASSLLTNYNIDLTDFNQDSIYLILQSSPAGICNSVYDTLTLRLLNDPVVNAGIVADICENDTAVLSGNITGGAGTGTWTTAGDGTFFPSADSVANAYYIPGPTDITTGNIQLTLTTTNTGICPSLSDQTTLNSIFPAPVANAGLPDTTCTNNAIINLTGSVANATGGSWTSITGNGSFALNTDLNTTYELASNEHDSAFVKIVLKTTGNGICTADQDTVEYVVIPPASVSAGEDKYICVGTRSVFPQGTITGVTTTGQWQTLGTGAFSPNNTTFSPLYQLSDADTTAQTVKLVLESTSNKQCKRVTDTMKIVITPVPSIEAGPNQVVCENNSVVSLNGTVVGGSGTGTWMPLNGDGAFAPSKDSLITLYTPGINDITNGSVRLMLMASDACISVRDTLSVTIHPKPYVYAGENIIVCNNSASVSLNGTVSGTAIDGYWETLGDGTIQDINQLSTVYTPSLNDKTNGSVKLVLHSDNEQYICLEETDTLEIVFGVEPLADFSIAASACPNTEVSTLDNSTITEGTIDSYKWIVMNDTINSNTLNYQFGVPGDQDVKLIAFSDKGCSDTTVNTIQITPIPQASFTIDKRCQGYLVDVTNTSAGGASWAWDFNNGTQSNDQHPTGISFDTAGTFAVQLAMVDTYGCKDTTVNSITIHPTPVADFSVDHFCEGTEATFNDLSSVNNDLITNWFYNFGDGNTSTNRNPTHTYITADTITITQIVSTVFCPDTFTIRTAAVPKPSFTVPSSEGCSPFNLVFDLDTIEDATYLWNFDDGSTSDIKIPTHTFTNNGLVEKDFNVSLTVQTSGGCLDSVKSIITVNPPVIANAGTNDTTCTNNALIALSGNVTNATGGTWSSITGNGTFGSPTDLNTNYQLADNELDSSHVKLVLETTGNGLCSAAKDTIEFIVIPPASVDAGEDKYICVGERNVIPQGNINGLTTTGQWQTLGSGIFTPNTTTLSPQYELSDADTAAKTIELVLESTNNKQCKSVTDTMRVVIRPVPSVNAGIDQDVCSNNPAVSLTGTSIGDSLTYTWLPISGDGEFVPSADSLNTIYTPGNIDITNDSVELVLTGTDICVSVYDTMTIRIQPKPIVNAGDDILVCDDLATTIDIAGTVSGTAVDGYWETLGDGTFNDSNQLSTIYTPTGNDKTTGSVKLVLHSNNEQFNCLSETDTLAIIFGIKPNAEFNIADNACPKTDVTAIDNSSISEGLLSAYKWVVMEDTLITTNLTYQFISSGDHDVEHIVYSDIGCTDTLIKTIEITPFPQASFSVDNRCEGYIVDITNSSIAGDSWSWDFDNGKQSNDQNPGGISFESAGIYDVQLAMIDTNGCKDTTVSSITIHPTPVAKFRADRYCEGEDAVFTDQSQINNGILTNWHYDFGDGNTSTERNPVHAFAITDSITITQIVSTAFCPDTFSIRTAAVPKPSFTVPSSEGCSPFNLVFDLDTIEDATYLWNFDDGFTSDIKIPTHTFTNNGLVEKDFNVSLTVQTASGCLNSVKSIITVHPPVFANAGTNDTTCTNNALIALSGNVTNATGGTWSSITGNGTFGSPTDLNTNYQLADNELDSSHVKLVLTTTGNGFCSAVKDTVEFIVIPPASVDAGEDKYICVGERNVIPQGNINGLTTTGQWQTLGSGDFAPNATTLSPQYELSDADTAAKTIELVLESTNNKQCNSVTDTMRIVIRPVPSVNAGIDQVVCANNPAVSLGGTSIGDSLTYTWLPISGDGEFVPSADSLNTIYTPGNIDITNDSVELVLTGTDICVSVYDTMTIRIQPKPIVNAGDDILVCDDLATTIDIAGTVSGTAVDGYWETLGDGTFNDSNQLSTIYTPTGNDKTTGSVKLVLHSNNEQFNCLSETDTLEIVFGIKPNAEFNIADNACPKTDVTAIDNSSISEGLLSAYKWVVMEDTLITTNLTYQFISPGDHDVEHIVYSDIGCTDTLIKTIEITPFPQASFSVDNRCEGYIVDITNSSIAGDSWSWDFDNGKQSNDQNPGGISFESAGNYDVQLAMIDANGCKDTTVSSITIHPTPVAKFKADRYCEGTEAVFTDQSQVSNGLLTNWHYDFGDGQTSTDQNPVHTYTITDSITITQIVSTAFCPDTFSIKTAAVTKPSFNLIPASGCSPLDVNFDLDTLEDASYRWDFGDGFTSSLKIPSHTFINNGVIQKEFTVRLEVQTASGCLDLVQQKVTVFGNPVVNFTADNLKKCSNDTIFLLEETENTTSLFWDFGDGTANKTVSQVEHVFENYTGENLYYPVKLIGTSANNCSDSTTKYVTVYPLPDIAINTSRDTACNYENITIESAPGGHSYEWDFGDGSYTTAGNSIGHVYTLSDAENDTTYQIELIYTSQNMCFDTSYARIVVEANPDVQFSLDNYAGCAPYYSPEFTNTSTGAFEYYWYFGTNETEDTLINDPTFTYNFKNTTNQQTSKTITLSALSSNGCISSVDRTVNIYPAIEASFDNTETIGCDPFNIEFESTAASATTNKWIFGDGFESSNKNPLHTFKNDTDTPVSYNTKLISGNAFGCLDTTDMITITVHPSPEAFFQINNSAGCSSFELTVDNFSRLSDSLSWNMGDNTIYDYSGSGFKHTYTNRSGELVDYPLTLVAYNDFGCTDTVSEIISVYPEVHAWFDADTIGCTPHYVEFAHQSEGAEYYNWTFGDGNTSTSENPIHTYSNLSHQSKTFKARLKTISEYGCEDIFERMFIVHNQPDATFTISDNDICSPDSVFLNDSTIGGELYHWDFGNGTSTTTNEFRNSVFYSHNSQQPQTYDIQLTVENEHSCSDTVAHTVTVYPQVHASFDANVAGCSPHSVAFSNTSDFVVTYRWKFGDGGVSGLPQPEHTYLNETTKDTSYTAHLIAESHFGCIDTASHLIEVYASPDPDFEITPSYQEFPNATVTINNSTPGNWQYIWDYEDGTVVQTRDPNPHTYNDWGTYRVILEAISTTHPQCKDTVSHIIQIVAGQPIADYDSSFSGCAPLTVSFNNKSINADWYEWTFGDGSKTDDENPTYTFKYPGTFIVRLKAMNINDYDISEKHTVVVHENPIAFFQVAPQLVTIPDPLMTYNLSDNAVKYRWHFGDGYISEEMEPMHYYENEGKYTITLEAWSEYGCYDSIVKIDEALIESGCKFIFPDGFTPNPDGSNDGYYDPDIPEIRNDVFHPLYRNMDDYRLEIYNKWGELLFISSDINQGWNGFYKGQLVPQGVYIWKAQAKCINGKIFEKGGTVTLIR